MRERDEIFDDFSIFRATKKDAAFDEFLNIACFGGDDTQMFPATILVELLGLRTARGPPHCGGNRWNGRLY